MKKIVLAILISTFIFSCNNKGSSGSDGLDTVKRVQTRVHGLYVKVPSGDIVIEDFYLVVNDTVGVKKIDSLTWKDKQPIKDSSYWVRELVPYKDSTGKVRDSVRWKFQAKELVYIELNVDTGLARLNEVIKLNPNVFTKRPAPSALDSTAKKDIP